MNKQDKQSRDALLARAAQEDQMLDGSLSPEALKRKRDREKKRKERSRQQLEKTASIAASEQEWWAGNRATLKPQELESMQAQDNYIRDLLFSMESVVNIRESDPELIDIVVETVQKFGTVRLGYIFRNDLPANWSEQQFWQDPALLEQLEDEGLQTKQFVKFGLLSTLPDWVAVQFLTEKAGWTWQKAADLVGYASDRNGVRYR
jgi:hypothetical protein